jgi:hypothetical protein
LGWNLAASFSLVFDAKAIFSTIQPRLPLSVLPAVRLNAIAALIPFRQFVRLKRAMSGWSFSRAKSFKPV